MLDEFLLTPEIDENRKFRLFPLFCNETILFGEKSFASCVEVEMWWTDTENFFLLCFVFFCENVEAERETLDQLNEKENNSQDTEKKDRASTVV